MIAKGALFVKCDTIEEANILASDSKFMRNYRVNDRLSAVYNAVVFQRRARVE